MNKQQSKSKRWLWAGIAGIAIILLIGGGLLLRDRLVAAQQTTLNTGDLVTAFIGDLEANASASGQLAAQREARLALTTSGIVSEIFVEAGDQVAAGDPLLKLGTDDLERAVANAQQTLAIQQANLETLLAPPKAADLAAAEAVLASAQANLNALLDGPTEADIAAAEANLRAAQADVNAAASRLNSATSSAAPEEIRAAEIRLELAQQAATSAAERHSTILVMEPNAFLSQEALNDLELSARVQAVQANANLEAAQADLDRLRTGNSNSATSAQAGLAQARAQRDAAQARLDLLLAGPNEAQLRGAEANVAQAQASLERLRRGPMEAQRVAAEVAVEQAAINLARAEKNLAEAILRAPFSGVITAVRANIGQSATGILVEMVDDSSLEVVLNVDEIDIGAIAPGQPAEITLETWPSEVLSGAVASISPRATQDNSAVVSYRVYLSLGETDLPLLVGMTANARLLTNSYEDVLLVPNAAINVDRSRGTFSVNRVITDAQGVQSVEAVPVTIGLRDGRYTQITSGLQEGDTLLVGNLPPRFRFGPPEDGQRGGPPPGVEDGGGPFGG
jgi:HlyD family secretion protein